MRGAVRLGLDVFNVTSVVQDVALLAGEGGALLLLLLLLLLPTAGAVGAGALHELSAAAARGNRRRRSGVLGGRHGALHDGRRWRLVGALRPSVAVASGRLHVGGVRGGELLGRRHGAVEVLLLMMLSAVLIHHRLHATGSKGVKKRD